MISKVKGNIIMKVGSELDLAPYYGELCAKGRFAFNFVQNPERITRTLIRRNSQLIETIWEESLNFVAKRFFDIKAMYSADSIGGFSCARATNEENFLMQKFMRIVIVLLFRAKWTCLQNGFASQRFNQDDCETACLVP